MKQEVFRGKTQEDVREWWLTELGVEFPVTFNGDKFHRLQIIVSGPDVWKFLDCRTYEVNINQFTKTAVVSGMIQ